MTLEQVKSAVVQFEMLHDLDVLEDMVDYYVSLRDEVIIQAVESIIDESPFADEIYVFINARYAQSGGT